MDHNKILCTFFHTKLTTIFRRKEEVGHFFCYETKIILGTALEIKKLNNLLSPSATDTGTRLYQRRSFLCQQ